MAYIKKEQSVTLTYPQRNLQIAVQGPHNTITQTVCAGRAPALNSGDSIITDLEKIKEGMARLHRGVEAILQNTEARLERQRAILETQEALLQEQVIIRQQQVRINQRLGRPKDGMTRLEDGMIRLANGMTRIENGMGAIHQEVRGIRHDISRQEKNRIARLINRRANRDSTVLEPLYGINGQLVPGFPRTLGDAKRLNDNALNPLLLSWACRYLPQGRFARPASSTRSD
ncbi:hypothetical protein B9Z19DRAFT_1128222 [Tuber borchii]|uniref:Uncharacterized protein n=1 Tax=Tuber borchii TaxID=42251 RepID=A0A2T6ZPW8_TUBBO|nr:hypothetical protein B9Z19DRAFT_1128222 [Tuber borchii]